MMRSAAAVALLVGLLVACSDDQEGPGGGGAGAAAGTGGTGTGTGTASTGGGGTHTGSGGGGAGTCQPAPYSVTADWYVSPSGTPGAAGTLAEPLDLATALSAESPAQPGQRVMVLGGTYPGRFVSQLAGAEGQPIIVLAEPGARVTLDGNVEGGGDTLTVEGSWVELHGLEVTSSDPGRVSQQTGSAPTDISLAGGVTFTASNAKLVNCVVHDTAQGVSFWSDAVDSELYGNIIYHNGWNAPDRGHGHAIYTQNATGTKRIARNVLFFGFSFGVHAYTEGGSIQGFDIEENTWFRTGASVPGPDADTDGCLVGGLQPVARARLAGNTSWAPSVDARGVQLGYGSAVQNEDVTLTDNFFVGRLSANGSWQQGTLTGNTVHGELLGIDPADYPDNTFSTALPQGQRVVVRDNEQDPSRAELVLYDWTGSGTVAVELGEVVPVGAPYEIRSVLDLWGTPVVSGTYEGGTVAVPLGSKTPPEPNGLPGAIDAEDDPGATFGVFVVRHELCTAD